MLLNYISELSETQLGQLRKLKYTLFLLVIFRFLFVWSCQSLTSDEWYFWRSFVSRLCHGHDLHFVCFKLQSLIIILWVSVWIQCHTKQIIYCPAQFSELSQLCLWLLRSDRTGVTVAHRFVFHVDISKFTKNPRCLFAFVFVLSWCLFGFYQLL